MTQARDMRARLVLSLRNDISAGLNAVIRQMGQLNSISRRISGTRMAVGGIVAGATFAGPIRQAAEFETQLRGMEITAGRTGAAIESAMADSAAGIRRLALETRTSSRDLLAARNILVARGLEEAQVAALQPVIARTAGASGAKAADLASMTVAFNRTLGISMEQMAPALAEAMRAGQLGGVELRDMAQYMGGLAATAEGLGLRGVEGLRTILAAFETVVDAFGSPAEAAAGMQQLLGHLLSDSVQKDMLEQGFDMRRTARAAQAQGRDPFIALVAQIQEAIRLRGPDAIYQIMGDQNSRQALQAILKNPGRMLDIRRGVAETPPDLVDRTLADNTRGLGAELRLTTDAAMQAGDRIGMALTPALMGVNAAFEVTAGWVEALDKKYPGLLDTVILAGAGFLLLAGALGVVSPVLGVLATGAALLLAPLRLLGLAMRLVLSPVRLLAIGLAALGVPFAGLIAVVTALAGLAALVFFEWDEIGPFFRGLWNGVKGWFTDFVGWVDGWSGGAATRAIESIKGVWRDLQPWFSDLWKSIGANFTAFIDWVSSVFDPIRELLADIDRRTAIAGAAPEPGPARGGEGNRRFGGRGGFAYGAEAAMGASDREVRLRGNLVIGLDPGLRLRDAETDSPGVRIDLSRGDTVFSY